MELAQLTCFSSRSPTGPYLAIVNQPNDGDQRTFQKPVTVRCENASALPTRDIVCFAQLFLCGQSRKDATVDSDSSLAYFSPPLEIASSLGGVASIPVSANHPICEFSDLKVHMTTSQMRKRCKSFRHAKLNSCTLRYCLGFSLGRVIGESRAVKPFAEYGMALSVPFNIAHRTTTWRTRRNNKTPNHDSQAASDDDDVEDAEDAARHSPTVFSEYSANDEDGTEPSAVGMSESISATDLQNFRTECSSSPFTAYTCAQDGDDVPSSISAPVPDMICAEERGPMCLLEIPALSEKQDLETELTPAWEGISFLPLQKSWNSRPSEISLQSHLESLYA